MIDIAKDEFIQEVKSAALEELRDYQVKDGVLKFILPALKTTVLTIMVLFLLRLL